MVSPQPNVYDFSFLSPCPTSGTMIYGKRRISSSRTYNDLNKRLSEQKGIKVEFESIQDANHFFKNDISLIKSLNKYIKKKLHY